MDGSKEQAKEVQYEGASVDRGVSVELKGSKESAGGRGAEGRERGGRGEHRE